MALDAKPESSAAPRTHDQGHPVSIMCVITAMGCGGAERVLAWLASGLARRGHRVALRILHEPGTFYEIHENVDVRCFTDDHLRPVSWPPRFLRRRAWLRRQMASPRPDVVLSFIDVANVVTLTAASGLGLPVVVGERAYPPRNATPVPYKILRRWLYRRAALVVVQTPEAATWARGVVAADRVRVLANAVPRPEPRVARTPLPALPAGPRIVAMGRLAPEKGFDLLVAAFALVAERHPGWSLVILGEGPLRSNLEQQVHNLGIADRVVIPGVVEAPERVLAASDLFVLSSRHEGFPNALCEAMACGLPVVSFDCPVGPRNIVRDAVDGLLVPDGDVATLASAVEGLILDEERRRELGRRAREVVDRFAEEATLAAWEDLLVDAANSGVCSGLVRRRRP